ncbi:MAG TPA: phosphate ABC transporter substrate-binding protein PstS [Hyphomicrobiales bacterium]|nr:phosphate ABC transporter substrate-binding protein PstS [Hyphomicrobiales bacterium]
MLNLAAAGLAVAANTAGSGAQTISGAGSTFVNPVLSKWAQAYRQETGVAINYQSIGSGGGIKQITAGTVTFGASDMPLKHADLEEAGLIQFPLINGASVPVVNLPGIAAGGLTLDGPTLAKIYLGTIAKWNDPAIQALNPSAKLPATAIAVVHRSDGSGTTFIWTDYLSKVSPEWKDQVGESTAVQWPVGIGAKGNEGVAGTVGQTAGAIGYVEYAYAKQNKLAYVRMKNSEGKVVSPTAASFQSAAAGAQWDKAQDYYVILTNAPGAESWPIAGSTFVLMHAKPSDPKASVTALRFFAWGYSKGKQAAANLDYVPMPDSVVKGIEAMWAARITDPAGKPLYTAMK